MPWGLDFRGVVVRGIPALRYVIPELADDFPVTLFSSEHIGSLFEREIVNRHDLQRARSYFRSNGQLGQEGETDFSLDRCLQQGQVLRNWFPVF